MSATFADLFCGGGGSSLGAAMAGGELVLGLNHWARAVETHSENFPDAIHEQQDISSLTTAQIRKYPSTDFLLASPECTNHSIAKGGRRVKPQAASLFDDGPAGSAEQDRSRATMWDVPRFAEAKIVQGRPYKFVIVENVADAFKWGEDDNGLLFQSWLSAMAALGYENQLVWLNSMFVPPTPQSRDRLYVVFWRRGMRKPNLEVNPVSWCPTCEKVVRGRQAWKRPESPLHQRDGRPTGAKFRQQYLYHCPECFKEAIPGAFPAITALDLEKPAERIGSRKKPLAAPTIERIRRGLNRLSAQPFALKLLHDDNHRPLTLPLMTLSTRHDVAMVLPVAGNTFERTPGNRARDAALNPNDTVHNTLDRGVVQLQRNGGVAPLFSPVHAIRAAGRHHALVMRNNKGGAEMSTPVSEPVRTLTAGCHQSVVVPYDRTGTPRDAETAPVHTLTTKDRAALAMSNVNRRDPKDVRFEPVPTQVAESPMYLAVPPATAELDAAHEWTDAEINDCLFRMFDLDEIARTMAMEMHANGEPYVVVGNKRERMALYGNAVTPPVMRLLVGRCLDAMDEPGGGRVAA